MHSPCCTCAGCEVSADTFSSTLDPKWTEESGSWSISGGRLDGAAPGIIYDSTAHPLGNTGNVNVQVYFRWTAGAGDNILRVLIGYQDTSNYLYAEFGRRASGCNYVQLGQVSGGVDTHLGDEYPLGSGALNTEYFVNLCYFYSTTQLRVTGDLLLGIEVDALAPGDKAGFEIVDGTGTFDVYSFNYAGDSPREGCPDCRGAACQIGGHIITSHTSIDTCFWTVEAGSWSVSSGYVPGASGSILRYNRPHPTAEYTMKAAGAFSNVSVGDIVRVYVNYLDENNNLFGQFEFASTTSRKVSVWQTVSGVATMLEERDNTTTGSFSTPTSINLYVCYDGSRIGATTDGGNIATTEGSSAAASAIAGGVYMAVGSDGGVTFTGNDFHKHDSTDDPGCPTCGLTCGCGGTTLPLPAYVVDLGAGGWTDGGDCAHCDGVAGEYVLGDILDSPDTACFYRYVENDVCAGVCDDFIDFGITLSLETVSAGVLRWNVLVHYQYIPDDDPACDDNHNEAQYYSDTFGIDECHIVPVTLTKDSDILTFPCSGSLPNTITLDAA